MTGEVDEAKSGSRVAKHGGCALAALIVSLSSTYCSSEQLRTKCITLLLLRTTLPLPAYSYSRAFQSFNLSLWRSGWLRRPSKSRCVVHSASEEPYTTPAAATRLSALSLALELTLGALALLAGHLPSTPSSEGRVGERQGHQHV